MEKEMLKCSSQKHKEINAVSYCENCRVYMCNKCDNFHSELFENHIKCKMDKDNQEILSIYCEEKEHFDKLKFYCRNHNKLCCSFCITKIKNEEIGQHSNCDIFYIKDIKDEKKSKLKDNIKQLEELSKNIEESINKIKNIYEQINGRKEELKLKIQKIFTKIRNIINNREDQLLLEIDNKYNEKYLKEESFKQIEKFPDKIKTLIKKGKLIDNEWNDDNKLNIIIKDCIDIENNIKNINLLYDKIKQSNNINSNLKFYPEKEEEIDLFLEKIKHFGKIGYEAFNIYEISKIIGNNKEYSNTLKNWISKDKNIKCELLYRLSEHGEGYDIVHELCDNKGPLLILYHVNDGNKIGIYTPLILDKKSGWKGDMETFIFNLNNNIKKNKKKKDDSLLCDSKIGIYTSYFGNNSSSKSMKKIRYYANAHNKDTYENDSQIIPNDGYEHYYDLLEAEIFKIFEI